MNLPDIETEISDSALEIVSIQVLDFIAFLQTRYMAPAYSETLTPVTNLHDAPFVGMWQDREDMQDSSTWVRTIRTQEWG